MESVTSVPLHTPRTEGDNPWAERLAIGLAGLACAVVATILHRPVIRTEPVFTSINVAVIATLITLGLYLIVRQQERFTGVAFALAGVSWYLSVLDSAFPTWGPYVAWNLSGTTYLALALGVLRYRRKRLDTRAEQVFIVSTVLLTVVTSFLAAYFIRPITLGYPDSTFWPTVIEWPAARSVAIAILCLGYLFLAAYFCVLMVGIVRRAPSISRSSLVPMAVFGAVLGVGSALVQAASAIAPEVLGIHHAVSTVGALILTLGAALAVSMILQQLVGTRFLEQLPLACTPETVSSYLRTALSDDSVELLYYFPETSSLIDDTGRRRPPDDPSGTTERFVMWIHDSDGDRVALLTGDPDLARDPSGLESLSRVLSIVAENARLNVVLRMRLAELMATRTAEALAFDKAKEQFHRNLHDGLQQTIASIRLDVDGLHDVVPTAAGHRVVSDLEEKLAVALQQVHGLKKGSDPPELRFGLKPAIDRAVAELRLPAICRVSDADLGILTLPVYYVVRESLTNVHKHARATHVEIDVTTDGRTVDVSVRDDGASSVTDNQHGGIAGMRRRVEELGGVLSISSLPGSGTTLLACIPRVS